MDTAYLLSKLSLLPEKKQIEVLDFIDFLFQKENGQSQLSLKKRRAGAFEGQIQILPHFDAPIEGMEKYNQ